MMAASEKNRKMIIWGHKLYSHTHSYIHSSYYKAFEYLGYEVMWLDHTDDISNIDLKDSIFFTEDQAKVGMPLYPDCKYIAHHINNDFFLKNNIPKDNVTNLGNYIYEMENKDFEKIDNCVFYDNQSRTLYQCWATDLLPFEIDLDNPCAFSSEKESINYVGSIWEANREQFKPFFSACGHNNKEFRSYRNVSDADNYRLTRESFIAPDIRGAGHLECGYIPCRVFKNISYGQVVGTNSKFVERLFGDYVTFSENTYDLFGHSVEKFKNSSRDDIIESMKFVKDKHTFINRAENLLRLVNE